MYGLLAIAYLFLGGAAGGSCLVMAAWSLAFHRRGRQHNHRTRSAFDALLSKVYGIMTFALIGAVLCLVYDLGIPDRALLVLLRPHPTILTFGAFILSGQVAVTALLAAANVFNMHVIGRRARKALEVIAVPLSLATMLYTGVFLASNVSIPFWNTPWLVALFFLSSLSSGISAVLLIDYFTQGQTLLLRAAKPLQKLHLACLVAEAAALALFLRAGALNHSASKSLALLAEPNMLSVGIVGVIVFGIALPFLLESYSLTRRDCRTIPFSDVVCLIGSFCLRWCVIMCGVH